MGTRFPSGGFGPGSIQLDEEQRKVLVEAQKAEKEKFLETTPATDEEVQQVSQESSEQISGDRRRGATALGAKSKKKTLLGE